MVKQGEAQRRVVEPRCFLCLVSGVPLAFNSILMGYLCSDCCLHIIAKIMEHELRSTTDQYGKQGGGYHVGTQNRDS